MITPRFIISQTNNLIIIKIFVPFIRVSESEIYINKNEFTFYCKPYYLKLAFQGELNENDEYRSAKYDHNEENGVIIAELLKLIPGTYFPDLDLPSKLLLNRKLADERKYKFPTIQVISENNNDNNNESKEQEQVNNCNLINLLNISCYGFNQKYHGVLKNHREEVLTMLTLSDPDNIPNNQRRKFRYEHELMSFDPDRYLGDFLEAAQDPIYIESMNYIPFWEEMWTSRKNLIKNKSNDNSGENSDNGDDNNINLDDLIFNQIGGFTEIESETMRKLPQRSYLINKGSIEETSILLSLIDILFAYCYDHRTTQGEPTVESSYTISILSPTLSSLENYIIYPIDESNIHNNDHDIINDMNVNVNVNLNININQEEKLNLSTFSIRDTMIQSARRCLIYPYLRSWKLLKKVFVDVTKILFLGYKCILKCLLQVHRIFETTDTHYLLNKLYLDDYCMWLQYLGNKEFNSLTEKIAKEYNSKKSEITKKDMFDLNIEELENSLNNNDDNESNNNNNNNNNGSESNSHNQKDDQLSSPIISLNQQNQLINNNNNDNSNNSNINSSNQKKKPLIEVISSTDNLS